MSGVALDQGILGEGPVVQGILGESPVVQGILGDGTLITPVLGDSGLVAPVVGAFSSEPSSSSAGSGVAAADLVSIFGLDGEVGTAKGQAVTPTGERIRVVPVDGMRFANGMGPFFSTVLPDGTIAMPEISLNISQVATTGKTMSCAFYHPSTGFYRVVVPTSTGQTETLAVNGSTGVVAAVGGADLCDSAVIWDAGVPVLFCLSGIPYRGWRVSTNGVYPVLPAFTLDSTTGRWAYDLSRSIFPATLRASDPTNGANVWPNSTNFYGETVTDGLLPCELAVLPKSNCLALAIYAPRSGHQWGSVAIVNPVTKQQTAWYEWPNMASTLGWGSTAFTRDINTDPTSTLGDERIMVNLDMFVQPNERFNVVVNASGGTFRVSWAGVFTSALPLGASAEQVRAALVAIAGIGAGNAEVKLSRPFLVATYSVYEVELVGSKAHTDYTATTVTLDTASLTANSFSHITRWQHGSTAYTAQAPFPLVELSYNNSAPSLSPVTVPMFPADEVEHLTRPERPDSTFGMGWYGQDGSYTAIIGAVSANPESITAFWFRGLHTYRKPTGGARSYLATSAPATGWENRLGEARPTPEVMTDPVHMDANALGLAIAEHQDTGAIFAAAASGKMKLALPAPNWAPRSGNLTGPATFTAASDFAAWGVTAPDTLTYDTGETAAKYTSGSTQAEGRISTAGGTAGIPVPAWMVGQVVNVRAELKAASTRRLVRPGLRFYDSSGAEIAALTGTGTASLYDRTTGYRTVMGAAVIPAGTAYLAAEVVVLDAATSEIHYYRTLEVHVAGLHPVPDVDLGAFPLYTGATGGAWLAKGFCDPVTGHAWLPYLQSMSEVAATNTRHPAWLVRADLTGILQPYVDEAS